MPNATPAAFQFALNAVVAAAVDFAATQAPGHDYIIVPHSDRFHPHCHLALSASNSRRCIDWGPNDLKIFQGLSFLASATKALYQLEPGRGKGKRPAGVGRVAYDHAVAHDFHQTKERSLAERLDYDKILKAVAAGDIGVSRRAKNGKPLSIIIDGRRVRLSTLRKAAEAGPGPGPGGGEDSAAPCATAAPRPNRRRSTRARPQLRPQNPVLGR